MKNHTKLCISIFSLVVLASPLRAEVTTFNSPSDAVEALREAASKHDIAALTKLFGESFIEEVASGDQTADEYHLEKLREQIQEEHELVDGDSGIKILQVGNEHWPFPAPLVERGGKWSFDGAQGAEEIINRRIGENELRAIKVAQFYVDAQRLYHLRDRIGSGKQQYAQKLISSQGKRDGLYWRQSPGVEASPLGPLVGRALNEGYQQTGKEPHGDSLYQGYYYRILTKQGAQAAGGAKDYLVSGAMTKGFALIAYPSRPGVSGIMSFIVGEDGTVYEKDLGEKTLSAVKQISAFNPDSTWRKVSDSLS